MGQGGNLNKPEILSVSPAGKMSSILASRTLSQVSVLCGGSHGRIQHATVYPKRVQGHRCQGKHAFFIAFCFSVKPCCLTRLLDISQSDIPMDSATKLGLPYETFLWVFIASPSKRTSTSISCDFHSEKSVVCVLLAIKLNLTYRNPNRVSGKQHI